jgi:hypothetical protein
MRTRAVLATAVALVGLGTASAPAGTPSPRVLRLDGIGPLKLGMSRADAVATGWLTGRRTGCELGGPPLPIVYRVAGPKAPDGVRGTAEFHGGHLRVLAFDRGVRTALGVRVGHTTIARMVERYRKAGYTATARYDSTFAGTFVNVSRNGRRVLGAFGTGRVVGQLGLRGVPVCE